MTDDTHNSNDINQSNADLTPHELTSVPEAEPTPSRTKKWLVGAALVTAGVVAGSGATYAITAQANAGQGQFSHTQRRPGGRSGGMNRPPSGADGQNGQQPGTQASQGAPSGQTSTG